MPLQPSGPHSGPYTLIDPIKRTLEANRLEAGTWIEVGRFADTDQVAMPPFEAVSLDLRAR